MKTSLSKINIIFYLFGIITLLLLWFILSIVESDFIVPSIPSVLIDTIKVLSIWKNLLLILFTIGKLILIVTISFVISLLLAIVSYKSEKMKCYLSPVMASIRTIPVASFVLILLVLVGSKYSPIFITLFVLIPILYENIFTGFIQIEKDIVEETKLISDINYKIIGKVFIPITKKNIISSILSSFGLGLKVLIMSEVIVQGSNTIGGIIATEKGSFFNMTRVFSWTLILIIIILIIEGFIRFCEKKMN
ncbi:putative uncharacterized protein [Coprobacillus sp. CAG:698]|nr:putative uncharacterized protein [Coprobacillus sp. CAG:698]